MDYEFALRWLTSNKRKIEKYAKKYTGFSPYDLMDLQSAANEAALIAARRTADAKIFPMIFWRCFQDLLRSLVPNPEDEHASASIPSYLCSPDIPTDMPQVRPDCFDFTTESIIISLRGHLSEKSWELLYLASGLSRDGKMSYAEVGARLGCSKQNVAKALKRCFRDIQQLIDSGKVARKIDLHSEQPGGSFVIYIPRQLFEKYGNF